LRVKPPLRFPLFDADLATDVDDGKLRPPDDRTNVRFDRPGNSPAIRLPTNFPKSCEGLPSHPVNYETDLIARRALDRLGGADVLLPGQLDGAERLDSREARLMVAVLLGAIEDLAAGAAKHGRWMARKREQNRADAERWVDGAAAPLLFVDVISGLGGSPADVRNRLRVLLSAPPVHHRGSQILKTLCAALSRVL